MEGGDPEGVGDGLSEVPRGELGAGDGGRRDVGEGALAGGADPGVGAVAKREEEREEIGRSDQPALEALEALAGALAAALAGALVPTFLANGSNLVLRAGAAFFGRARRSALFR